MRTPPSSRDSAGFTLLEMLVVLAIVAFVAAITMPRTDTLDSARHRALIAAISSDLKSLRDDAMREQRVTSLESARGGYLLRPSGILRDTRGAQIDVVVTSHFAPAADDQSLRFYSDGSSNGARMSVTNGSFHSLIEVRAFDGEQAIEPR